MFARKVNAKKITEKGLDKQIFGLKENLTKPNLVPE